MILVIKRGRVLDVCMGGRTAVGGKPVKSFLGPSGVPCCARGHFAANCYSLQCIVQIIYSGRRGGVGMEAVKSDSLIDEERRKKAKMDERPEVGKLNARELINGFDSMPSMSVEVVRGDRMGVVFGGEEEGFVGDEVGEGVVGGNVLVFEVENEGMRLKEARKSGLTRFDVQVDSHRVG